MWLQNHRNNRCFELFIDRPSNLSLRALTWLLSWCIFLRKSRSSQSVLLSLKVTFHIRFKIFWHYLTLSNIGTSSIPWTIVSLCCPHNNNKSATKHHFSLDFSVPFQTSVLKFKLRGHYAEATKTLKCLVRTNILLCKKLEEKN